MTLDFVNLVEKSDLGRKTSWKTVHLFQKWAHPPISSSRPEGRPVELSLYFWIDLELERDYLYEK